MPAPGNERGQMLLAEEYFATENPAFLEIIRRVDQPKALAGLADRWKKDPRPWARTQALSYVGHPFNCPGHQPVIRRLFKHAEAGGDHQMMAAFLVAFDRQVRRQIRTKRHWERETQTVSEEEQLFAPRDVIPLPKEPRNRRAKLLFRYRTRYYLRRRAWRHFRSLGHRDPAAYQAAIVRALAAYDDADLQRGENILDSWGLLHACFGEHEALEFGATQIQLKEGRSLGDLKPAPVFPATWKTTEAAPLLLTLAAQSRARLVRVWAMQLYLSEHAQRAVALETIVTLLDHEDAEIQQFGARLLGTAGGPGTLPIASWLRLLQTQNEEALQLICESFGKHVAAERLEVAHCVALAMLRPVPVARLGQRLLRERTISSSEEREQIVGLAGAKCPAVSGELATWALGILGSKEHYDSERVIRFFDSPLAGMRGAAWAWLIEDSVGLNDAVLWSRLAETPHDDLRLQLIDFLQRQTKAPGSEPESLQSLWQSVILGVHRGGRQKAKAVKQIAKAIMENPARGDLLLPVLAAAVRSVRGPEARAGLAAVVSVAEAQPQLGDTIRRLLPEMKLAESGT